VKLYIRKICGVLGIVLKNEIIIRDLIVYLEDLGE
jgi:hypothetical protein